MLCDRLRAQFGPKQIFMDLDSIELGENFVEVIETTVSGCDVLLAVIGNNWFNTKDEAGARRLDNPVDWVRTEIGTALKRKIRVIPILVGSALMPRSTNLPEDLKPLANLNALRLTSDSFEGDLQRLAGAIRQVLEKVAAEQREKERLEAEQREKERLEKERLEAEQREQQRLEAKRREKERLETEQCEKARLETDRPTGETPSEAILDENIQFTTYRPSAIDVHRRYQLLVFTHVEAGLDDSENKSPTEEMEELAKRILGSEFPVYLETTSESLLFIPRESQITFVPEIKGLEFYPPTRSFLWAKDIRVHPETFWFRAGPESVGKTLRGRLSAFLGHILLAEIILSVRVIDRVASQPSSLKTPSTRAYRRIFASYSHADSEIVEATVAVVGTLGDEYLRDVINLRAGENWSQRLMDFIYNADVFQLFWSINSAKSKFVEQEWRYALDLKRKEFIRPTYWQMPMPQPPELLNGIHFYKMPFLRTAEPLPTTELGHPQTEPGEEGEKERLV